MTETSPLAACRIKPQHPGPRRGAQALRAKQGTPRLWWSCASSTRRRELAARDGKASGAVQVRGPWVTGPTTRRNDRPSPTTAGSHRRHRHHRPPGLHAPRDRTKDMIKSGGEWISSLDLENAVWSIPRSPRPPPSRPHPKWDERPLVVAVRRPGAEGRRRGAARVPAAEAGALPAARRLRMGRRDPQDRDRQVPENPDARDVPRPGVAVAGLIFHGRQVRTVPMVRPCASG